MKKGFFIQSNNKQLLGAKLAQFAFEKSLKGEKIPVTIINVDELDVFKNFSGKTYLRKGRKITYKRDDLQSFTLSRFMPPQLMNFEGRAVVIDPDIFALYDISPLFDMDLQGKAVAACGKKDSYDSSVMVLDCSKLREWNIESILNNLALKKNDYDTVMTLKNQSILEIGRMWNSIDVLEENTKMLHTSNRLTQPWKTGLPIDFRINPLPKIFGLIPREPIHKLFGKYPTHYEKHPDPKIEEFFFTLLKEALAKNVVTKEEIQKEIRDKNVREDILETLNRS